MNYPWSELFPFFTVERQYPSHALAAIIISCWDILQGKNNFLMYDRIIIPKSLSDGQWISIELSYRGISWILNLQNVSLLESQIILIIPPNDHNLLLGDLYGGRSGKGLQLLSLRDIQSWIDFFPHSRFLIESFLNSGWLTMLWIISLFSPSPPNL